jgi:Flp pilus assembly protein TadD
VKFQRLTGFSLLFGALIFLYFATVYQDPVGERRHVLIVNDSLATDLKRINPLLATADYQSDQLELIASNDLFLRNKTANTIRIVIQGEGPAAGFPYYYNGTFSKMLEQWLQYAYPQKRIEVINTALVTSHLGKHLARVHEIIELEPDLVIFYGGHHELNAAYERVLDMERDASFSLSAWTSLKNLFQSAPRPDILESFNAFKAISTFEDHLHKVEELVRSEANQLFATYREYNIPVIALEPVANLSDFPPLQTKGGPLPANQQKVFEELQYFIANNDWEEALKKVNELEAYAMDHADFNYLAARVYAELGRKRMASRYFDYARQHDDYVLRGHPIINAAYKTAAINHGHQWIQLPRLLRKAANVGLIGDNLMLGQSNFNQNGHFFTAQVLAETIMNQQLFGVASHLASPERMQKLIPIFPADAHYGDLIMEQLTLQWPYYLNGYRVYGDKSKYGGKGFRLAQERFNQRISHREMHLGWMRQMSEEGNFTEAMLSSRMLTRQYPNSEKVYFEVAVLHLQWSRQVEAEQYFQKAFELSSGNNTLLAIVNELMKYGEREAASVFASKARKGAAGSNQLVQLLETLKNTPPIPG